MKTLVLLCLCIFLSGAGYASRAILHRPVTPNHPAPLSLKGKEAVPLKALVEKMTKNKPVIIGKIILLIIAFFIPPLGVALYDGIHWPFWINLLLTLLLWLPGMIHAWWFIITQDH
jgi:uncharacterized membrane protein YqaE (UPF0057 family)